MNQYRCIVVECCGKCIHSAYRSPTEQFCNREKPHWTLRLDQWADGISSCCTLPYQSERETVLDELKSVYEAKVRKDLSVLRPQVLYFALRMEEKLRKHDKERGSRGWVGYTQPEEQKYLFRRLVEEVKELENAITRANACGEPLVRGSSENVDVGNFAMMLYTAYYGDDTAKNMIDYMLEELRQKAGEP